jgi:hypothetical protein
MNTISHYYLTLGAAPNIRKMAVTPQEMRAHIDGSMLAPGEWTVTTVYADGHQRSENGHDWIYANQGQSDTHTAPMPAFYSEATQKQLVAALDRYNERYDNTAYLAACHSLRLIEDQPEYIQQAIRIQDVALYPCGAQNLPCISPTRITREMVLFWMNFASDQPQDDDAEDLPF